MFVDYQNFAADAGECAEKGGRLWDGSGIQAVIKKEKKSGFLIEKIKPLSVQRGAGLSRHIKSFHYLSGQEISSEFNHVIRADLTLGFFKKSSTANHATSGFKNEPSGTN